MIWTLEVFIKKRRDHQTTGSLQVYFRKQSATPIQGAQSYILVRTVYVDNGENFATSNR